MGVAGRVHASAVSLRCDRNARARPTARPAPPVVSSKSAHRRAGGGQVLVAQRIDDRVRVIVRRQLRKPVAHRIGAGIERLGGNQADRLPRLRREHTHEIGVGHRRQRVVAHARVRQEYVAHEEVPAIDRAQVARIRGRGGDDACTHGVAQRFGDRTDIALWRRIERRAVLE